MSVLLATALRWQGARLTRPFDRASQQPRVSQTRLLHHLLRANADTRFGREHDFAALQTIADYQRAVPLRDYEALRPYVQCLLAGEADALTAAPTQHFALTSGTTAAPKYIPVTAAAARCSARLLRQWLYRYWRDRPAILNGRLLGIVSPAVECDAANGLPAGSSSGRAYQQLPWLARRAYAVPYEVFELRDYEAKYLAIAQFALQHSLSLIATPNASTLLRLAAVMHERQSELLRALYNGTPSFDSRQQPELAARLQRYLRPARDRARQLARIAERTGSLRPRDCWPQLQGLGCWLGGSAGLATPRLSDAFGDLPRRDLGYLASEGRFTLPIADGTPAGVLAVGSNFCEFIPEADLDADQPRTLLADELTPGDRYGFVVTTAAGLYRYRMHDLVEVTGYYEQTPLLAFVRKTQEMTNLTGEKLHANHAIVALQQVNREQELAVVQSRLAPCPDASGYELCLELATPTAPAREAELAIALDRALQAANCEYAQKRQSQRLRPLQLHWMQPGWAQAEVRAALAKGQRDVQYKPKLLVPALSEADRRAIARSAGCPVEV